MRQVTGHEIEGQALNLEIHAIGTPGSGGANSLFQFFKAGGDVQVGEIRFQEGTIPDAGVNGVTLEAVISVCIDQLTAYQAGPYANKYNADALVKLTEGRAALQQRTLDRIARGVEGKVVA